MYKQDLSPTETYQKFYTRQLRSKNKSQICSQILCSFLFLSAIITTLCGVGISLRKQCTIQCPGSYKVSETIFSSSCECKGEIVSGDIIHGSEIIHKMLQRNNINSPLWTVKTPGSQGWIKEGNHITIPYELDRSLDSGDIVAFRAAINEFTTKTCIRFRPKRKNDITYLQITNTGNCWSYLGKVKEIQSISIGPECTTKQGFLHLLMHMLGFDHEHTRPDRDDYIEILLENADNDAHNHFEKTLEDSSELLTEYDLNSVLHITSGFYSKDDLNYTIRNKQTGGIIQSSADTLSKNDVARVNMLYKCNGANVPTQKGKWSNWTRCSRTCGEGYRYRFQTCTHDSKSCQSATQKRRCTMADCAIYNPSVWSTWSSWSPCKQWYSHYRYQKRSRVCSQDGKCHGVSMGIRKCQPSNSQQVQQGARWSEWSSWSDCSATCGKGIMHRTKECTEMDQPSKNCVGHDYLISSTNWNRAAQIGDCFTKPCASSEKEKTIFSATNTSVSIPPILKRQKRKSTQTALPFICPYGKVLGGSFCVPGEDDLMCLYKDGTIEIMRDINDKFIPLPDLVCQLEIIDFSKGDIFANDLNGDGLADIACLSEKGLLTIYLNQGEASFPAADQSVKLQNECLKSQGGYIAWGQFNGDKFTDIVCGKLGSPASSVYYNQLK